MNETERTHIGGLVVTHGRLGHELVAAAEMIVGEIPHILPVSIGWHDDVDRSREEIKEAIISLNRGGGVIILTDMFGGTPSNLTLALLKKGEVEIVTGVNLPMIIKLAQSNGPGGRERTRAPGPGTGAETHRVGQRVAGGMIRRVVRIRNHLGLHARAAAKLVKTASRYDSDVKLSRVGGAQQIDGKSILGILLLAASYGTELEFTVRGSDEIEAAESIESLVRNRFGEEK